MHDIKGPIGEDAKIWHVLPEPCNEDLYFKAVVLANFVPRLAAGVHRTKGLSTTWLKADDTWDDSQVPDAQACLNW